VAVEQVPTQRRNVTWPIHCAGSTISTGEHDGYMNDTSMHVNGLQDPAFQFT